ncbi:hypothetical protein M9H77_03454 [Catharanthus roseus]|uniref:Uncharacterized protein n=1 Tax=Catharanthus roseus TaxID=4058 RepID=A0ACC0CBR4_CATRO|nr:hypothetical protein M9H77_03454 [Catharanthus roseus]
MSSANGDIQNVVQDIEALRDRMDAQEAAVRTLEGNLDQRFLRLDQCFDEMINRFDALGVNTNKNRNDGGQRLRNQLARGGVANVSVAANDQNQIISLLGREGPHCGSSKLKSLREFKPKQSYSKEEP